MYFLETKRQAILADLAGMTNTRESLKNEVLREQKVRLIIILDNTCLRFLESKK